MKNTTNNLPPKLQPFAPSSSPSNLPKSKRLSSSRQPPPCTRLASLDHETHERPRKARNAFVCFALFRALRVPNRPERTLLVTTIPRYQKTTHPKKPAIKLPTMELAKLTKSLFSQRQPRRCRAGCPQRWTLLSVSFWH